MIFCQPGGEVGRHLTIVLCRQVCNTRVVHAGASPKKEWTEEETHQLLLVWANNALYPWTDCSAAFWGRRSDEVFGGRSIKDIMAHLVQEVGFDVVFHLIVL